MKRSGPLPRRTPLTRTTRLKPIRSEPRKPSVEGELTAGVWRELVLSRAGWRCEVRSEGCTGTATEAHHRYRFRRPNTPANGISTCRACHACIHAHPEWAFATGLLVRSSASIPTEAWHPDALLHTAIPLVDGQDP